MRVGSKDTCVADEILTRRRYSRSDTVSDIAGEKLNEAFARKCVEEVLRDSDAFAMLLPHAVRGELPYYYLLTSREVAESDDLSKRLDDALSRAFHYRSARQNGRLEAIKVHSYRYARELFIRYHDKKGMTVEDPAAKKMEVAVSWKNLDGFRDMLVERLSAAM